jgi:predicted O-methyltransferase YrrM
MWYQVKAAAKHIVPGRVLGAIDYVRFPARAAAWGGPFNGQSARQALFREMVAWLRPYAIVETGTYLGTTTEFIAQTGLPVYTIEVDRRNYGFARARLRQKRNVMLCRGDSRGALRALFDGPLGSANNEVLFVYLDAHWSVDLPLAEELEIIFGRRPTAVVMVDDFQVPFDAGYAYDDYGPGKALIASHILPAVSKYQLQTSYPSMPSFAESGLSRGCVVLAKKSVHGRALSSISLLRLVEQTGSPRSNQADRP